MNINRIINEELEAMLNEKLANVDDDVNTIYEMYFAKDIEEINNTGIVTKMNFAPAETNTSILKSDDAIAAHTVNPSKIFINKTETSNSYFPQKSELYITPNNNAIEFIMSFGGNLKNATNALGDRQAKMLPLEFSEEKFKGSIHHELAHWIDDSIHNRHLHNTVIKYNKTSAREKSQPVGGTKFEIEAQMHNIKQLYNKYKDKWDEISFKELIALSPALDTIYESLRGNERITWIRNIKTRMFREKLLGKRMINN